MTPFKHSSLKEVQVAGRQIGAKSNIGREGSGKDLLFGSSIQKISTLLPVGRAIP